MDQLRFVGRKEYRIWGNKCANFFKQMQFDFVYMGAKYYARLNIVVFGKRGKGTNSLSTKGID